MSKIYAVFCAGRVALCCLLMLAGTPSVAEDIVLPPIPVQGGEILLTPDNTESIANGGRRLARVAFAPTDAPVVGPKKNDPAHQLLRRLVAQGRAAGNLGDLYENRDRNHSRLRAEYFPQLTRVEHGPAFTARGYDYGVSLDLLFDAPLIGNSSTALTSGRLWRSQARFALTTAGGPARLYQNYRAGQIHVYPEHRDHDPKYGDLLPANTPYMLISQGSSGSDRAHLEALAMILAAFRPDTKAVLKQQGLLAPTVQMVYRRARLGVRSREAYLSGGAHPSAFRDSDIQLARMVGLANAITPEEIPPLVKLQVLEERPARPGVDFFGQGLSEVLFDTPAAIARVWRAPLGRRSMVVSAADTMDINGRALRFDWAVLRGDHSKIRITPLTEDGRVARIDLDWQGPQPAPGAPDLRSARIDIGVFANNGVHDSAPSFVSILLPQHEARAYEDTPDGPRIISLDRSLPKGSYADPVLFPNTRWVDRYHYDNEGKLSGWTRVRGKKESQFDAAGNRLDAQGEPLAVTYEIRPNNSKIPTVYEEALAADGPRVSK